MRSIPVFGEESIAIARSYDGIADFLLLDSYRSADKQIGALGVTHDWNMSRRIVDVTRIPVVLAGGLGPDNVAEAIRSVRPAGVDSKTRTDKDGSHTKDLERVRRFLEAARAAALPPPLLQLRVQKATSKGVRAKSAIHSKADIRPRRHHVREGRTWG